jgi:hypothetical protein
MTDQRLEEYLQPRRRNNGRRILDQSVEALEAPDLVVDAGRLQHEVVSEWLRL